MAELLKRIVDRVAAGSASGERPVVLIDLDLCALMPVILYSCSLDPRW